MRMSNFYKMNLKITNRDLLRNYKKLKEQLLNGEVEEVSVVQKDGFVIKMVVEKEETGMEHFLRMIEERGPVHIKPIDEIDPDFYDFLP